MNDVKFFKDTIMKKIFAILAISLSAVSLAKADDIPVTFAQLPVAAQKFIQDTYPDEKVSYAMVDDDFIRPDYSVVLASGIKVRFNHDGSLEKIEARGGVPASVVPVQIMDYVKIYVPDATVVEYEVGRFGYEVKLSNRMELNFNRKFKISRFDD